MTEPRPRPRLDARGGLPYGAVRRIFPIPSPAAAAPALIALPRPALWTLHPPPAASTTYRLTVLPMDFAQSTGGTLRPILPWPKHWPLMPGYNLTVGSDNFQAGDQISGIVLTVTEHPTLSEYGRLAADLRRAEN